MSKTAPKLPATKQVTATKTPQSDGMFEGLLKHLAPCGFIANQGGEIVRTMGSVHRFFETSNPTEKRISTQLLVPNLHQEITELITTAAQSLHVTHSMWLHNPIRPAAELQISIFPMTSPHTSEHSFVVSFVERVATKSESPTEEKPEDIQEYIRLLEKKVASTKAELRQATESLRATTRRFQDTSQEMQSANEELIFNNAALEISNEQLQSTNADLVILTEEVVTKTKDLSEISSLLQALIHASPIAIFMVDPSLLVRISSSAGLDLLGLREVPKSGVHLSQCTIGPGGDALLEMCSRALLTREPLSQSLSGQEATKHYFVNPCFKDDGTIEGLSVAVLSLSKILTFSPD